MVHYTITNALTNANQQWLRTIDPSQAATVNGDGNLVFAHTDGSTSIISGTGFVIGAAPDYIASAGTVTDITHAASDGTVLETIANINFPLASLSQILNFTGFGVAPANDANSASVSSSAIVVNLVDGSQLTILGSGMDANQTTGVVTGTITGFLHTASAANGGGTLSQITQLSLPLSTFSSGLGITPDSGLNEFTTAQTNLLFLQGVLFAGDDTVTSYSSADGLYLGGGAGADTIHSFGSAGNDFIYLTHGDNATGGIGSDEFIIDENSGTGNVINDFTVGQDKIRIDLYDPNSFQLIGFNDLNITYNGNGNVIEYNGVSVTIPGSAPGSITADFFVFGTKLQDVFNVINGSSGDNTIIGTDGADELNGQDGNDILDGSGGRDRLLGGAGDDTIYYDANDDLANVQGGSGNDTLVVTSGSAPTSFDLGAHGFEDARLEISGFGQGFRSLINEYDAFWQLTTSRQINDDGSLTDISYERSNESWDTSTLSFDTNGSQTQRFISYDAGNSLRYGYDTTGLGAGAQDWLQEFSDQGGTLTRYTDFDQDSDQIWTSTYNLYDGAGVRTQQFISYDDATSARYGYVAAGDTDWLQEYHGNGVLARNTDYDQDGTQSFIQFYDLYDTAGVQTQKFVTYDNGTSGRFGYDAAGQTDWLQENRADGTLQYYTDFDQANTETWEHFVNTYDVDGTTVLSRHFFNDDGSDFFL